MKKIFSVFFSLLVIVVIINIAGCSKNDSPSPLPPTITGFSSVNDGTGIGYTIIITGTNFSSVLTNNVVKFNGVTAVVTNATSVHKSLSVTPAMQAGLMKKPMTINDIALPCDYESKRTRFL